jgi:hypothetical protein
MRLSLDVSDKWWIWPQINKIKKEENILYDPELRIMSKNLPSVDLELSQFKKINLDSMFANALAHNFMLQEQFADLSNFIASKKVENQNIKPSMNQSLVEKNKMDLIKTSYDLTLMKWIENPMKYSFLPKGLIELRHSLLQVIGQNESSEARFLKVGNKYFYHTQLTGISPIDVYVPLNSGENRSYQVKNLGKNPMENQKFFESEFLTLMKVDESMMESVLPETPNVLSVMDVLENISLAEIDEIKHTHIMSFYITQSKEILNSVQDQEGVRIAFLQSIDNILKFLLLFKEKLGVSELHT